MCLDREIRVDYYVNSFFYSRTYLLFDDGRTSSWIVDCGDIPPLEASLSMLGSDVSGVKGVLLTHAHFDHIYGLQRLMELNPAVRVYTNEYGKRALADSRMNLSRYHGEEVAIDSENVVLCREGDVIELYEGVAAKVYETPGHNPSCLTFEVGDNLFTGDAYIPGMKVVTLLPGGEKEVARRSEERIRRLAEGKHIWPGHDVA